MSTIIFGSTGLCGAAFLKYADKLDALNHLVTVTRRSLDYESSKLEKIVEADSTKYPGIVAATKPKICYTSLATTRGAAGSAQAFVDIDYGINYDIAKAAKESGVETFVLISSIGASALSPFLYMKTKGRLEDDVIALKFPRTIILRPGPLLGEREKSKGFLNSATEYLMRPMYKFSFTKSLFAPIYGDEVGKAAELLIAKPFDSSKPVVEIVSGKELFEVK
ncbi:CIC11C00000005682 [Sungouiella intermedia]|uniref:CIC11C00000005682 n=1 Tax=Sungouiella intermedia TaxID=45354 RepID=A0A1L0DIH1_9ASCO|nr:CIC11C00000005682 [[Candida] intermedia]